MSKTNKAGLSAEEKAALKELAAERRNAAKREKGAAKAQAELQDVLDKIAEMSAHDQILAKRIHELVLGAGPQLAPRTWYGMPAYALDGKVLCFFQGADKFKARYASFGFNDSAKLDDGNMWATSFALTKIGDAEAALITELVTKAVGGSGDSAAQ